MTDQPERIEIVEIVMEGKVANALVAHFDKVKRERLMVLGPILETFNIKLKEVLAAPPAQEN